MTELMVGSLKVLLRDHTQQLDWATRVRFGLDIAQGMMYLHDLGTVHRGTSSGVQASFAQHTI